MPRQRYLGARSGVYDSTIMGGGGVSRGKEAPMMESISPIRSLALNGLNSDWNTKLRLVSPVQSKSDRLIDLLDLFRRESRDSLLDQNFRQSGDVVKMTTQRAGMPSLRS